MNENAKGTCPDCQVEHHNICPMLPGCSCCADTAEQDGLFLYHTCVEDAEGVDWHYAWWATDADHAIEQSRDAWPEETTHFAFKA